MPEDQSGQISDLLSSYAPKEGADTPAPSKVAALKDQSTFKPEGETEGATPTPESGADIVANGEQPKAEESQAKPEESAAVVEMMRQMQGMNEEIARLRIETAQKKEETEVDAFKIEPLPSGALFNDEEFNALFNAEGAIDTQKLKGFLEMGLNRTYVKAREDNLRTIPSLVSATANRQAVIASTVSTFWAGNKDLSAFKSEVGLVADQIAAEHPTRNLSTVLDEAATVVRGRLAAYAKAEGLEKARGSSGFAQSGAGGARPEATPEDGKPDGQDKQITQMLKAFA